MTDERSNQIEQLFQQAVVLSERERQTFLERHTGGNPEIRREVEELLAHFDDASGSFLDSPLLRSRAPDHATGPVDTQHEPQPRPERVGRYPVLDELGRGGMGVVYLASDPQLERKVAIKVLPGAVARDPSWLDRFRHEARILASLNHPNIATVYSLEEEDGLVFITMELVEGEHLAARTGRGPLLIGDTLSVAQQIAAALEAAHQKDIVHRDLKPLNIMITGDGRVKVLDFGLAHSVVRDPTVTARDRLVGTPGYMTPEQLRGESFGLEVDVWAFGCVLYECLTGELAFGGDTVETQVTRTLQEEPDWTRVPAGIPERVLDVVKGCLVKDVASRLDRIARARREIEEAIASRARPRRRDTGGVRSTGVSNNLPIPLSSFVGREVEVATLSRLIDAQRLVTLVGSGGCGKSRLAIEVGRQALTQFPDGVWLVELASVTDPADVTDVVAAALDVHESPDMSGVEAVSRFFAGKRCLLIVDNCEHVLDGIAPLIEALARGCDSLVQLTTSRETLGVPGETTYRVPSLAGEGVQLFVERAAAVSPGFTSTPDNESAITTICDRLDGIPLAIELAAARVRLLSPEDIASRLDDRFRLLTGGSKTALARHKTLRALIDWSHEQLDEKEKRFFARLSVFVGGWTLDAAEAVCTGDDIEGWEALDVLTRLVDKSLAEVAPTEDESDRVRFRMLETVRTYAADALEDPGETEAKLRSFFAQLTTEADPQLDTPQQASAIARLAADFENLKHAVETGIQGDEIAPEALDIAKTIFYFASIQGRWREALGIGRQILAHPGLERADRTAAGHVYHRLGNIARSMSDIDTALACFESAMEIWKETGHRRNQAAVLNNKGLVAQRGGDHALAKDLFTQALEINRELGTRDLESTNLNNLGLIATEADRVEEAANYFGQALEIARELDHTAYMAVFCDNLATVYGKMNDNDRARELHAESIALSREVGNRRGVATALLNLGHICMAEGDLAGARSMFVESLEIKHEIEDKRGIMFSLEVMADLALRQGDGGKAVRLLAAAKGYRTEYGTPPGGAQKREIEMVQEKARSTLGERVYEQEWAAGSNLSIAQAVSLALSI